MKEETNNNKRNLLLVGTIALGLFAIVVGGYVVFKKQ